MKNTVTFKVTKIKGSMFTWSDQIDGLLISNSFTVRGREYHLEQARDGRTYLHANDMMRPLDTAGSLAGMMKMINRDLRLYDDEHNLKFSIFSTDHLGGDK